MFEGETMTFTDADRGLSPPPGLRERGLSGAAERSPSDTQRYLRMEPALVTPDSALRRRAKRTFVPTRNDTIVADSIEYLASTLFPVRNWADPSVEQFENRRPIRLHPSSVTGLVLHETRGPMVQWEPQMKVSLEQRLSGGLAVHGYIDHDGTLYQHNDLVEVLNHSRMYHVGTLGFEIVNPMHDGNLNRRTKEQTKGRYRRINVVWDKEHRGHYLVPPVKQLRTVCLLTSWLTGSHSPLDIPFKWIQVKEGATRTFEIPMQTDVPGLEMEGVVGHGQYQADKTDGVFPALFCWLRLQAELSEDTAFAEAVRLLSQSSIANEEVVRVDLSDYAVTGAQQDTDIPPL